MSEFVILRGRDDFLDDLGLTRVEIGAERAPSTDIVKTLPLDHPLAEYWSVAQIGKGVFDDLVTDAQKEINKGHRLEDTRLGKFLQRCAEKRVELYAWYADDANDLDELHDLLSLRDNVETALREATAEIYIHFKMQK